MRVVPQVDLTKLRRATGQSVPNAAYTDIAYGTVVQQGSAKETTGVILIARTGVYLVSASFLFTGASGGSHRLIRVVSVSGAVTTDEGQGGQVEPSGGFPGTIAPRLSLTVIVFVKAGDSIKIQGYQDSGAALLTADTDANQVSILYQGER